MLIGLDLDCTLIEGYLTTKTCEECEGKGYVGTGYPTAPACKPCKGTGQRFGKALPYDPVTVMPGRREKILELAAQNHSFFIATNQGGVAHGFNTVIQVETKLARVLADFNLFHGQPISVHIAYHDPKAPNPEWHGSEQEQLLRKPLPGMLLEAMHAHGALPDQTIYVGDLGTDRAAAEAAGVPFALAEEFFA